MCSQLQRCEKNQHMYLSSEQWMRGVAVVKRYHAFIQLFSSLVEECYKKNACLYMKIHKQKKFCKRRKLQLLSCVHTQTLTNALYELSNMQITVSVSYARQLSAVKITSTGSP